MYQEMCEHEEPCGCYGRRQPAGLPKLTRRRHLPPGGYRKPKPAKLTLKASEWRALVKVVLARPLMGGPGTKGPCERCGQRVATDPHHRWLRAEGGPDVASNLAALCRKCHDWCHQHVDAARLGGWIVPTGADWRTRALLLWDGQMVTLNDDGGYSWAGRPE